MSDAKNTPKPVESSEMAVGSYYGVDFLVPSEKSLRGRLVRIVNTDEGRLLLFYGRSPWSVMESDIISVREVGPETRTPRESA